MRLIAVVALVLTSLALLTTLLQLEPFALDAGGLTGVVAWIWLAVYVALPPPCSSPSSGRSARAGASSTAASRPAGPHAP